MKVLILYHTRTGHTLEAANAAAEGIRGAGGEAEIVEAGDLDGADLSACDGLIVASPCWGGSIAMGVAWPVLRALNALPGGALAGVRCGAISVHSGFGGERTIATLGKLLAHKGCDDFYAGPAARAGSPLSIWVGPPVSDEDAARYRDYGARFVNGEGEG
jgi:flavodoxin